MIAKLRFDWFLYTIHGLLPDEAIRLAWSLPVVFLVLGVLLAAVRLKQLLGGDDDWKTALAGGSALLCAGLTMETLLFAPLITWLLIGPPCFTFAWFLHTYSKDCLLSAIAVPLLHGFPLYAYRSEIADWFDRILNPRRW